MGEVVSELDRHLDRAPVRVTTSVGAACAAGGRIVAIGRSSRPLARVDPPDGRPGAMESRTTRAGSGEGRRDLGTSRNVARAANPAAPAGGEGLSGAHRVAIAATPTPAPAPPPAGVGGSAGAITPPNEMPDGALGALRASGTPSIVSGAVERVRRSDLFVQQLSAMPRSRASMWTHHPNGPGFRDQHNGR
jgi:hypothetical protein